MRVLYLVGNLGAGGLERFVTRVCLLAKNQDDFEPSVCCWINLEGQFLPTLKKAGVPVYECSRDKLSSWMWIAKFTNLVKELKPDLVHSQVNWATLSQVLAVKRAGDRISYCVTERNCYPLKGLARLRRIIQFHLIRALGADYSANSYGVRNFLAKQVYFNSKKISVVPNGVPVDYKKLKNWRTLRYQIREKLGWKNNEVGLGYVARMAPHKGQEDFIFALSKVIRKSKQVRAVLIGDGQERFRLEKLCIELGIEKEVNFLGRIAPQEVEEYYYAFDIKILSSFHEGMPNVILEAMAASCPVIATNVGAIPELLDDGNIGIIIPPHDVEALYRAIDRLVTDGKKRVELGEASKKHVVMKYSIDITYKILLDYYKKVIIQ